MVFFILCSKMSVKFFIFFGVGAYNIAVGKIYFCGCEKCIYAGAKDFSPVRGRMQAKEIFMQG